MIGLLASPKLLASVELNQFWHDRDTATIYGSYAEARNALLAWDTTTAHFELEKAAAFTQAGSIADSYVIKPQAPETGDWEYKQQWTLARYDTEEELIADYEQYFTAPYNPCGTTQWVPDQPEMWHSIEDELGVSDREFKYGKMYWGTFNEPTQTCLTNEATHHLERERNVFCEAPRNANQTAQACTSGASGKVFYRPVTASGECRGNPCNVATGDKIESATDYVGPGLEWKRTYHSAIRHTNTRIGERWTHNYSSRLINNYPNLALVTGSGFTEPLIHLGSNKFGSNSDAGMWMWKKADNDYWLFYPDGHIEFYDDNLRLVRVQSRDGLDTYVSYDSEGKIDYVTGPYGHVLDIVYGLDGMIEKLVDPAGNEISYTYQQTATSGSMVLSRVTYQDGSFRDYLYETATADLDTHLTGIIDENGERFATYGYDAAGLVILSEHAGGRDRITLSYTGTTTEVIESGGSTTLYQFSSVDDAPRKIINRTEAGTTRTTSYPTPFADWMRHRPVEKTNERGATTRYSYNSRQLTAKTEAYGTSLARTTNYTPVTGGYIYRYTKISMPSVFSSGKKEINTVFDSVKRPTSITVSGYEPSGVSVSATTALTYHATGKVGSIDGPLPGSSDTTVFDYYDCVTGSECGQLKTLTNALGHVSTYDAYDDHGRLLQMTDPNGLVTNYSYDVRGRLLSVTLNPPVGPARVTGLTYDNVGQLQTATYPDGRILIYAYDAAHDLESVTDNFGNKIEYGYDARGNRTSEEIVDPSGVLKRAVDYTYDLKNHVDTITSGGFTTDTLFDALGELAEVADANAATTEHSYDVLGRLTQTVDALLGVTDYAYDVNDNLVSVTAPNGATTTYVHDDLGNLLQETSPDRGTTTYAYDSAGNLTSRTDARGKQTTYGYDALNRIDLVTFDSGGTIDYVYDTGVNGIGRLARIIDSSGQTNWSYNPFGETTEKTQVIGAVSLTTSYAYDAEGRLSTITYPSGKVVSYGHDTYRPVSASVDAMTVLSAASYDPFGAVSGWTWGDGSTHSRTYDMRGLMTSQSLASDPRTLGYDPAGYLTSVSDSRHTDSYGYDLLGRLEDFLHAGIAPLPGSQDFDYDANGNRTSFGVDGSAWPYTVGTNSNRLLASTGPVAKSYSFDAAGNVTSDGVHSYAYDDSGRFVSLDSGAASYVHNGLGQRVSKDTGTTTLFVYSEAGQLLGEYDAFGAPLQEHVWFEGAPVAVLSGTSTLRYVHTDHLGTPRAITAGGTVVWRWESDPFGTTAAREDPDGDLVFVTYGPRFPGQYFDGESGLHYNYFRTYDPSTGRYLESDPIGLAGGLNTYGYVGGNPLSATDPYGLDACYVLFPDYPITYNDEGDTSTWLGGHAGILGYDDQGRTRYYEYGRYSPDRSGVLGEKFPSSRGNVRRQTIPDLEMDDDGNPTPESMERLEKALEKLAGKGTEAELSCDSEADEQKVYDFVEALANDKDRKDYNWVPFRANHCRTFAKQALRAGQ